MSNRRSVDEFKLIGLLWRDSPASPRSGISRQSVTALAVDLADREGLDAVTIRRLAEEAGVTAMALYPHIGGRAELVELMLDHVAGVTYEAVTISEGADWRERVTAIAEANWASCQAHPWITDLATGRPVPGPGASSKYETELRALDGIGLADIDMDYTLTAVLSLVQGTARATLAAQRSRQPGEDQDIDWWSNIEPTLTAEIGDRTRFPTASRVSRTLGEQTGKANDPEGAYRRGVSLILDGIAQQIGRPRA
ncbi:TetR/AcrR family transcriptional regulator [Nesterenkonia sp. HG001]|uniref:TetR/AcrR family transcriptional regulator n=1 Tax=Nesterenkonia sp. HG001 TaxID=2983207 RepID=UPI002AC77A6B|nr:TetR/AcrR family transcriptional regulator [Nesterenkonia sp. HG001]MDZ5078872.1 TetR/AcrR family transcriptional regulator [Nesterenkonia sp. HG001]